MQPERRRAMRRLGRWLGAAAAATPAAYVRAMHPAPPSASIGAAAQASGAEPDAERNRYRGIAGGGELFIDADYDTRGRNIVYTAGGEVFARGSYGPKLSTTRGYFGDEKSGGLPLPGSLRMLRYPDDAERNPRWRGYEPLAKQPEFLGPPRVDVTVPVASRIPDAVLDRIRRYGGSLKLKLRLTREMLLVGWEVINGKSYPFKRDQWGNAYVTDEDVLIGGDFSQARVVTRLVNGRLEDFRVKGWQINPKTGQKIETDF